MANSETVSLSKAWKKILQENIGIRGYADDYALHRRFQTTERESEQKKPISELEQNSLTVKTWIPENRLKMTELILFGIKNEYGKM